MNNVMLAAAVLLLASCAHVAVQDIGHGQHSLTASAPSGGYDGSREEAIEEANEYCAKAAQNAVIDGFFDKSALGPNGEHSSSIIFRCATQPPKGHEFGTPLTH